VNDNIKSEIFWWIKALF